MYICYLVWKHVLICVWGIHIGWSRELLNGDLLRSPFGTFSDLQELKMLFALSDLKLGLPWRVHFLHFLDIWSFDLSEDSGVCRSGLLISRSHELSSEYCLQRLNKRGCTMNLCGTKKVNTSIFWFDVEWIAAVTFVKAKQTWKSLMT